MFDLTGKKALVTGASGGIGQAIAKTLHGQGAEIVLSGTRENILTEIATRLKDEAGADGAPVHIVPANLSEIDQAKGLIPQAIELMSRLDILVNNAGITRDNLAMRMKQEEWDQVLGVNLSSTFALTQSALKGMMKNRFGRVITITSVVGAMGNPGQANYCAAKAGLVGMTKSIAKEVASRGVTLNCIAPGFIETAMTGVLPEAQKEKLLINIPVGKMGEPADIASAVAYLASDEAKYITGETININGGMAML